MHAGDARFNKFARFEFNRPLKRRTLLQSLRAHATSKCHKEALKAFSMHGRAPPSLLPASHGDVGEGHVCGGPKHDQALQLLAGRVPTAQDWRDAMIECEEGVSLRKAERMARKRKEEPHAQARTEQRKVRRKQYMIMAEVVRTESREALYSATSCTLSLDGSAGRKVVLFRCDLPQSPWFKDGCLGILDENAFQSDEEFTEDHATRAACKLDELLARFCTPWGKELDHDLKDHISQIVHLVAADGCPAERRAMYLAGHRIFENMIDLIRDPAHAIRKAMESLCKDDFFKEMWDELFNNQHSLVPFRGIPPHRPQINPLSGIYNGIWGAMELPLLPYHITLYI